jgi:hypothetical protein
MRREADPVPFGERVEIIKSTEIHLPLRGGVVGPMKSIPEEFQCMTGLALVLNGLAHWEFVLFDPLHQVPWALVGFRDLLNVSIEEYPFCLAHGMAE